MRSEVDLNTSLWNPCGDCDDHEFNVVGATGSYIELADGRKLFDATSSWWCKSLGHGHPRLKAALIKQLDQFEHVLLGRVQFDVITELSNRLCGLTDNMAKACFASDGSCAVEQAMKMSLQTRKLCGSDKTQFASFKGDYHGDTLGALSVTDGVFREEFDDVLMETHFISGLPYVAGRHDPLWHNCETEWQGIQKQLEPLQDKLTAFVLEPIVQGAAGMKIYSPDLLRRLRDWCNANDVHLIADEIMTGLYRTGTALAIDHAGIEADFMCLGKGLTSGMLPMSVTLVSEGIVDVFRNKHAHFMHSHTFAGNALAAAVALEVLNIMSDKYIENRVAELEGQLFQMIANYAEQFNAHNIRVLGGIAAMDFTSVNYARNFCAKMLRQNVLLRPLGKTVYWCPPLIEF